MPSSYTASLRFEMQGTGENLNNWGTRLNTALTRIDKAIAGYQAITLAGATYTLSSSNTADDEARAAYLDLSGTGGCNLVIPSVSKVYTVRNGSTGNVVVTTGGATTVTVGVNDVVTVFCDGATVRTHGYNGMDLKSYIAAAALAATGSLPATAGNAGKYVYTDGTTSYWRQPASTDLSDISALKGLIAAMSIAL